MGLIAGADSRTDLHRMDPNRLVIVTDPASVLCQEVRNRTPTPEWLVLSIMAMGVTTPIQVRRGPKVDGEYTYEVVVGRQRVKAARTANERLIKLRRAPVKVKVEVVHGTDDDMLALIRSENVRVDMSPLERAETAKMSIDKGVAVTKVINDSFRGSKADFERHMALLACHPGVIAAIEDGRLAVKAVDTFTELSREDQEGLLDRMVAEGKTGPREARTIAATAEETLQHNGTGRPGAEPATRTKNTGPKARNAGEMAARLAAMEATGDFRARLEKWAKECGGAELDGCDGGLGHFLALILPAQYFGDAESLVTLLLHEARRQELRWALRDDAALDTASEEDLGGWVKPQDTKVEKAAERAAKKEAEKAEKAAAKQAAKEQAKADKIAAREAAKQAAKDAKEAEKARVQAEKEAAAAKRAAKKQSKASAAKQVTIEAAIAPAVAPKVPTRKGAQGRGKGKRRGRK